MMSLRSWIKQIMPEKVFVQDGAERYINKDFEIPPDPAALVRIGMFPDIAAANQAIAKDKSLWGGSRHHSGVDDLEAAFGAVWPATLPMDGKPVVLALLRAANHPTAMLDGVPVQTDMGYGPMIDEWLARGLIK